MSRARLFNSVALFHLSCYGNHTLSVRKINMGGTNPYIKTPEIKKPKKPFHITFTNIGRTIEVLPDKPTIGTGLEGSILDLALTAGVDIDHACGGVCACSTCHIYIKAGEKSCSLATENFVLCPCDTCTLGLFSTLLGAPLFF